MLIVGLVVVPMFSWLRTGHHNAAHTNTPTSLLLFSLRNLFEAEAFSEQQASKACGGKDEKHWWWICGATVIITVTVTHTHTHTHRLSLCLTFLTPNPQTLWSHTKLSLFFSNIQFPVSFLNLSSPLWSLQFTCSYMSASHSSQPSIQLCIL